MDFVDDVDLEFALCGCEFGMIDNFSDIIDASVARCIYLNHIYHFSFIEGHTICTLMTRIPIRCYICTVYCLSKDTSKSGFTDTMKAKKYVSMMKSLCTTRISKDFFYKILTDNIRKYTRAIWLVERHENTFCKLRTGLFYRDILGCNSLLWLKRFYDFLICIERYHIICFCVCISPDTNLKHISGVFMPFFWL